MFGQNKRSKLQQKEKPKPASKASGAPRPKLLLLPLESRLMFDAAAAATASEVNQEQVAQEQAEAAVSGDGSGESQASTDSQDLLQAISTYMPVESRQEIVFVDPTVPNYQELLSGIDPDLEVIMLDGGQDGIQQMANALAGRTGIDAIHLISHGDQGQLSLGTGTLTQVSMTGQYADELAMIKQALSEQADILVYGCEFAEGQAGREATTLLSELTGADVAASIDLTGAAALGGDWILEVTTGTIESDIAITAEGQAAYGDVLDIMSGLTAQYAFEEGSGTTAADTSGNNRNGTLVGEPTWTTGQVGTGALNFGGDFDLVEVTNAVAPNFGSGNFSVGLWMNSTQTTTGQSRLIGDYTSGTNGFIIYRDNTDLVLLVKGTSGSATLTAEGLFDGDWHQVVTVRNGTTFQLFVDGQLSSSTVATVGDIDNTNTLRIGASSDSTGDYDGRIDDVRMYTRALTSGDVAQLYATSNDAPINVVPGAQAINEDTNLVFSSGNGNQISITDPDADGGTFEVTIAVTNGTLTLSGTSGLTFVTGDGTADSTMTVRGTVTNINAALNGLSYSPTADYAGGAALTISTTDSTLVSLNLDANLQARYTFDGNANDVAPGTAQNGTLTGNATIVTDATRGQVLSLDGADDYIDLTSHTTTFATLSQGTLSAWVKLTATGRQTIFDIGDGASNSNFVAFYVNNGQVGLQIKDGGVNVLQTVSTATINDGTWHHVAFSVDGSGNQLYIDGAAVARTFISGSAATTTFISALNSTTVTTIGAYDNGVINGEFLGMLDEVCIYSRALSGSEVVTLAGDLSLTDTDTVAVTVSAVNDAPVLADTALSLTVAEDAGAPSGVVGSLISAFTGGITDVDSGAAKGIAITGTDETNGTWYYTTNGGSTWTAVGAVSNTSALLLADNGSTRLYFAPSANYNGTVANAITFHAWDQTSGTNGDTVNLTGSAAVRDNFATASYSNNDGLGTWSTAWTENDTSGGGASSGNILISGGQLRVGPNAANNWVYRQANLSGASTATLSYTYDNQLISGNPNIRLEISSDGGSNYTTLENFSQTLNAGTGTKTYDITSYISSQTQVRFVVTSTAGGPIYLGIDNFEIAYIAVNTGGTTAFSTATDTASLTVTPVNDVPTITSLSGDGLAYSEGAGVVVIEQGGNALVADVDSTNLDTGTLTVSIPAGGDSAEDVLSIRHQGTGAGQIGVSGSTVTYGGTTIGTFTGGSSGSNLVITLNSSATPTAVMALVKNITYENTDTNAPTTGARTVRYVLTDGDGGTSANYDTTITVSGVNDAPVAVDDPPTFSSQVLANQPVGYWRLDELSGTTATNRGSLGTDGNYSGPTLGAAGAIAGNTATNFDGVNDSVNLGTFDVNGTGLTMTAWFNADDFDSSDQRIISKALSTGSNQAQDHWWMLSTIESGSDYVLRFRVQAGGTTDTLIASSGALSANQWNFAAATYDETTGLMQLYLNGTLVGSKMHVQGGAVNTDPTQSVMIGANPNGYGYFDGRIDEVAVFDRAISQSQLQAMYDSAGGEYSVVEDGTLSVSSERGVLANDSDVENNPLTAVLVTGPSNAASFTLNADGSFTYAPVADFSGTDTFTYRANDGMDDSALATVVINVLPVNDAPTITSLSGDSLSYTEGDGAVVIEQGGNALVADVDSTNFDTGTLTVSIPAGGDSAEDVLSIQNQGTGAGQIGVSGSTVTYGGVTIGTFVGGSSGSSLVITLNSNATPTAVTTLVQNITYENTDTNAPTTGARTVRYVLTDGGGGTSANYDTTVTVSGVNDAPVFSVSGASGVVAGQAYTLNLGATDADGVTISSWTINWGDGTIQTLAGNPSSVTHIYADDLGGMTLNITVAVTDADGTWFDNRLYVPTWAGTDAVHIYEGQSGAFVGTMAPMSDGLDDHIEVIQGPNGNLYISSEQSDSVLEYTTAGVLVRTFVAAGSGGLNGSAGMAFGPDGHLYVVSYQGNQVLRYDGSTGAFLGVVVEADTGGFGVPLGLNFGPDGMMYVVSRANNSIMRFDAETGAYDASFSCSWSDANLEDFTFGPDGNLYAADGSRVVRLNGSTGAFIDSFVASDAGGLSYAAGLTFGPDGRLYVSDQNADAIRMYHGTTGAYLGDYVPAGGGGLDSPAYITFAASHMVTITGVNDAPVLADTALSLTVAEDAGAPSGVVGSLISAFTGGITDQDSSASKGIAITGTDETNGTWYYTTNGGSTWTAVGSVSNTSALLLADNGSTRLYFAPSANYTGTSSGVLTLRAWDQTSGSAETKVSTASNGGTTAFSSTTDTVDVTVTAVNDAPTDLALSANTVVENAANGTVVGTVSGTDPDSGDTKTYSLTDAAGGRFAISSSTGEITVADGTLLDYESATSHSVTVRVTDSGGLTYDETFAITVTNVNDAPTITNLSGDSLSYTEGDGAVVIEQGGNALVADVDSTNLDTGTLTVSIPVGGDSAEDVLSIKNQGTGADQIGVSGANVTYQGVTIGTFTGGSSGSALIISLNSNATPTAVTALVKNITYENTDTSAPTTGARTVRYVLTDGDGGTSANYDTTVTVSAVNDAPTDLALSANTVAENAANGTVVGTVSGTDPDSGDTKTYSLTNAAAGRFAIDSTTGQITVADGTLLDYESATSHSVTVRVTDAGGLTYDETFAITVTNVNDAPTFMVGDGIVTTNIRFDEAGSDVVVQPDGKILVVGTSGSPTAMTVTRYNRDGSLDTSFGGGDGIYRVPAAVQQSGYALTVQADGKILLTGYSYPSLQNDVLLVRLNSDGSLDTGFGGGDGVVTTDLGVNEVGRTVALQVDGKILVGGYTFGGGTNFMVARYNTDGSLDTSFGGGDGVVTTSFGGPAADSLTSLVVQLDGKIVVAGGGGNYDLAIARYNGDGSLDTSFGGGDGLVTTRANGGGLESFSGLVVQADGKLVAAGFSGNDLVLVRYHPDGSLDTSLGGTGIVVTSLGAGIDGAYDLALQNDGKIVLVGRTHNGSNYDVAVVRYNSNGTMDTSFGGGDGIVTTAIGSVDDQGVAVAIQSDGKIVVSGKTWNGTDYDIALLRYNADGTLDVTVDPVNTLNGTPTYTEGGAAVVLDADVQIFDAELSGLNNFSGATLTLVRNGGANAEDQLVFDGTVVTVSGLAVSVSGVQVGTYTFTGGEMTIAFNGNATQALVNTLMQHILYYNVSDTPPASAQINWTFSDGNTGSQGTGGALQATGSTTVTIIATNDAPTITSLSGDSVSYSEGDGAVVIEQGGNALAADVDSTNLDTGTLTVSIPSGGDSAEDVLSIRNQGTGAGQIGVSGSNITYGGTTIGTFTGGSGGSALVITLNSSATPTAVTALVQNITYENTDTAAPTTGARTVRYVLTDGDGGTSANYDTTVTVSGANDAPVNTVPGAQTVTEDTPLSLSGISVNDVDGNLSTVQLAVGNGTLNVTLSGGATISSGSNGTNTLTLSGSQADINATLATLVYQGALNFNGSDTLTVTSTDANSGSDVDTVAITVTAVNDPTVVTGGTSGTGNEDTIVTGTLTATDVEGLSDGTVFTVSTNATNGTASIDPATGLWSYTPTADYNGSDSFTVTITDDAGNPRTQVISVSVTAVADITNDSLTTNEDTAISANVLTGTNGATADSFEGTPVLTGVTQGANGSVTFLANGTVTYTPTANFNGTDSFTYSITSGGVTETATVTVTVTAVDDPTVVTGGTSGTGNEDTTVTGTLTATDVEGLSDGTVFTVSTNATNGTASIDPATGLWSYTPTADYNGSDSFTVTITDDAGNPRTQVISVSVTAVNDAPVLSANTGSTVAEGGTDTIGSSELAVTDIDNSSAQMSYSIGTGPTYGRLELTTAPGVSATTFTQADIDSNRLVYVHDGSETTSDSFTFTVGDGAGGALGPTTMTLTITPVNDTPNITSDGGAATAAINVAENVSAVTIVTGADVDLPAQALTYSISGGVDQALFTINTATGALNFTVPPDFEVATDANGDNVYVVQVQVTDSQGASTTQTIQVTVTDVAESVPPPPVLLSPTPPSSTGPGPGPSPPVGPAEVPTEALPPSPVLPGPHSPPAESHPATVLPSPTERLVVIRPEEPRATIDEAKDSVLFPWIEEARRLLVTGLFGEPTPTPESEPAEKSQSVSDLLFSKLDEMTASLEQAIGVSQEQHAITARIVALTGTTLSAGFIAWALRSGTLLASFMATMPAWRHFDPLPVLGGSHSERERRCQAAERDQQAEAAEFKGLKHLLDLGLPPDSKP